MKTFDDLEFKPWGNGKKLGTLAKYYHDAEQALLPLDNGYTVSVLFGHMFYSNGIDTYEVAVINKDGKTLIGMPKGDANVEGYCSKERVNELIKWAEAL